MAQLQAKEAEGWDEYKRYCFRGGVQSENNPWTKKRVCVAALTVATRRSADWHSPLLQAFGLSQLNMLSTAMQLRFLQTLPHALSLIAAVKSPLRAMSLPAQPVATQQHNDTGPTIYEHHFEVRKVEVEYYNDIRNMGSQYWKLFGPLE